MAMKKCGKCGKNSCKCDEEKGEKKLSPKKNAAEERREKGKKFMAEGGIATSKKTNSAKMAAKMRPMR